MPDTSCCPHPVPTGTVRLSDYLIELNNAQTNNIPPGFNTVVRLVHVPANVMQAFGLPETLVLQPGIRVLRQLLGHQVTLTQEMADILQRPKLVGLNTSDLSVQRAIADVYLPTDPSESEVADKLRIYHENPSPPDSESLDAYIAASQFLRALDTSLAQALLSTFIVPVFEPECPPTLNPQGHVHIVVEATGNGVPSAYRQPIAAFRDEDQALLLVRLLTEAIHSAPLSTDYAPTVAALRAVWPLAAANGISSGYGDIPNYTVMSLPLYSQDA